MALYDDTGKPCQNCDKGTYVEYLHGIACRFCGELQPKRTVTPRSKNSD